MKQEMCVSVLRLSDSFHCFHILRHNFQRGLELFMGLNLPGHKMKLYSFSLSLLFSLFFYFFFTLFLTWPWLAEENNTHCTLQFKAVFEKCFINVFMWTVIVFCERKSFVDCCCAVSDVALNLWGPLKAARMFVM